ncbi:MAG: hypothetical protein IPF92_30115 [Myxococcales bacterium]|nr:hypothetical protein [Myxococcales bacterium]
MARIGTFCVDRYEATVVTVEGGKERPRSPYQTVGDASVRARSAPNVVPQAYISQVQAPAACAVSCWDRREERGPRNKEQGLRSGDRGTRNKD